MHPSPLKAVSRPLLFSRPWFLVLAPLLAVRSFSIVHYYFSENSAAGPMNMIPVSLAYHTSVLVLLTIALLWAVNPFPPHLVRKAAVLSSGFLMALGAVDFLVQHHLGSRLSLPLIKTYGLSSLLHPEVYLNLAQDRLFTAFDLGSLLIGWGLLFFCYRRTPTSGQSITLRETGGLLTVAALLIVPVLLDRTLQRGITQPPELVWLRTALPERAAAPVEDQPQLENAFRQLAGNASEKIASSAPVSSRQRPDIFILAVESLRARNLPFISDTAKTAHIPNLSELSKQGIIFSRFIANGFPSTEGFLAIHCSLRPHPDRRILVQLTDLQPDCLPARLRRLGYHTGIFWGVNPDFDNQLSWAKRWYDDLVYQVPGNIFKHHLNLSDAGLFARVIGKIRQHDESKQDTPVFAYIANAGTHVPFTLRGLHFDNPEQEEEARRFKIDQAADSNERYNRTLELLDLQIGKFWKFLKERKRPFVLVVLGDHSIPTTAVPGPREKRLPSDDYLWTGALLVGPESLIGVPRKVYFPASQVDVLPTLLRLAGDTPPFPGLGTDLLADLPVHSRKAVAIREGHARLDRNGRSLQVNLQDPSQFEIQPFSGDNTFADGASPSPPDARQTARELQQAARYWAGLLDRRAHDHPEH